MNWVGLIKDLGIPIVIIFAIGWFAYKKLWPFFTSMVNNARDDIKAAHQTYSNEIKSVNEEFRQIIKKYDETTNKFLNSLEERDKNFRDLERNNEDRHRALMERFVHFDKRLDQLQTKN